MSKITSYRQVPVMMVQKCNAFIKVLDSRYALIRNKEKNSNPEEDTQNTTESTFT